MPHVRRTHAANRIAFVLSPLVNAQFIPPQEQLADGINLAEEIDCLHIFAEPLPIVVKALQTYQTWDEALQNLPDVERDYLAAFNPKPPYSSPKISI